MYLNRHDDESDYYHDKAQARHKGCGPAMGIILVLILLLAISFTCSRAQGGPYWAYKVNKPGIGKVTKRKKAWGVSHACSAYAITVYQKDRYVRRLQFWKPTRRKK